MRPHPWHRTPARALRALAALVWLASLPGAAHGWWGGGHQIMTRASLRALPGEMPVFFRTGEDLAAQVACDADLFKDRAVRQLESAEKPEHYWDAELVGRRTPPSTRYGFLKVCADRKQDPAEVGMLPYAVVEWTQRLTMAFAEHRRWPEDPHIRAKCLVYAGMLAHYAQDLCQPLHVTVDYDGRKRPDGTVEAKGIHEWMDRLVERLPLAPDQLAVGQALRRIDAPMPAIWAEIGTSRDRLDTVYGLGAALRSGTGGAVEALALERARAGVTFTASLYWHAWQASAAVDLPDWLEP
jgi:hypothetical protein